MNASARISGPSYGAGRSPASARALVRAVQAVAGVAPGAADSVVLERRLADLATPPRIVPATAFEPGSFARAIPAGAASSFAAFLDGVQVSRAAAWIGGVPAVVAEIGAVVLKRAGTSLVCWEDGVRVRRIVLVPRERIDTDTWDALAEAGQVEDTRATADDHHPDALLVRAVHAVETLRTGLERDLAERWVARGSEPLYVDGGLGSLGEAAHSPRAVGVVKSHRTLYAHPSDVPALFAMREAHRTRVQSLAPGAHRPAAWTWYLRLRTPGPANPLHGLVRIEVVPRDDAPELVADEISRWVLAERSPVSMPDARWDVLAYGIARCEAYLKRGLGLAASGGA